MIFLWGRVKKVSNFKGFPWWSNKEEAGSNNFIHTQLVFTCFYVIVMRNTGPEKTHKKPNRNKGKRVCVGVRRVFSPQFPKNLHLLLCDKTEMELSAYISY